LVAKMGTGMSGMAEFYTRRLGGYFIEFHA
jgi:hypothetical protein